MPCSASSTATSAARKVRHEALFRVAPPCGCVSHSLGSGRDLVRVDRAQYRWHKQKPYYEIRFAVLKPKHLPGPS